MAVHFIGFRGNEYHNAVKAFGQPDFVHMIHDNRMYGEVDINNDILVFGPKADPRVISKYSDQTQERF